ncbi:S-type anion channel SLAH2-like isoform X2 [Typha angustifolia]
MMEDEDFQVEIMAKKGCDEELPMSVSTKSSVGFDGVSQQLQPDNVKGRRGEIHGEKPMPAEDSYGEQTIEGEAIDPPERQRSMSMDGRLRDKRFDSFKKTWSDRLERRLSSLRIAPQELDVEANGIRVTETAAVPDERRYFDVLEGPGFDTLRTSEVSVLPEDKKWPFLLRFPINSFGMCLGVSSQAVLWKALATSPAMRFLHVSLTVNLVLWCIALALVCTVSLLYSLKIMCYFEAVRREYYHPIRVNFFFAPWIACLLLAIGVPSSVAVDIHTAVWYIFMAPIFLLELKIYGQWLSGGQRRLAKVANPSSQLSIVGNFVGALLGASMGLLEGAIFFFAVGLAYYTVLFIILYLRVSTNATLPKELHPIYFFFVAVPSIVCLAWAKIRGEFDNVSKIFYFIALFIYFSLAARVNFFRGFRFSLAWWAYTFPMTAAAVATVEYSAQITNTFTRSLSIGFSAISTFAVIAVLMLTIYHAFVLNDLFPNDIAIANTKKRSKLCKKLAKLRSIGSDMRDIETSISGGNARVLSSSFSSDRV